MFSVYWKIGDKTDAYDVPNIGGLLFLWVTLPAYGACAYTPVSHKAPQPRSMHATVRKSSFPLQMALPADEAFALLSGGQSMKGDGTLEHCTCHAKCTPMEFIAAGVLLIIVSQR